MKNSLISLMRRQDFWVIEIPKMKRATIRRAIGGTMSFTMSDAIKKAESGWKCIKVFAEFIPVW